MIEVEPPISRIWGVLQLLRHVTTLLRRDMGSVPIRVRGELSGISSSNTGNVYFDLKESNASLKCWFPERLARLTPLPDAGAKVDVEGLLGFFEAKGSFQLSVSRVSVVGDGTFAARVEKLKLKLRAAGYFDVERKRSIPNYIFRVALVTSPGSKAESDFREKLRDRSPFVRVRVVPTSVQGQLAADSVASAIRYAGRLACDVLVITRGGGSDEDRSTFNEEAVAKAIFESPVPVITAIGHREDHHIADDVADLISDSPGNAAIDVSRGTYRLFEELSASRRSMTRSFGSAIDRRAAQVIEKQRQLVSTVLSQFDRLSQALDGCATALPRAARHDLTLKNERIYALQRRLDARSPAAYLAGRSAHLSMYTRRLAEFASNGRALRTRELREQTGTLLKAMARTTHAANDAVALGKTNLRRSFTSSIAHRTSEFAVLSASLAGSNPETILQRGYAIVRHEGKVVTDPASLRPGDRIAGRLARGSVTARVEETQRHE